jgi:phage-related protein
MPIRHIGFRQQLWRVLTSGHSATGLLEYLFFDMLRDMPWTVLASNSVVEWEIAALPADMRARFVRYSMIVETHGFETLPRDAVKHLEGPLWELRLTGRDGISRAIYLTAQVKRVIVLRVFVKKTQKTPKSELELARQRAKDVT